MCPTVIETAVDRFVYSYHQWVVWTSVPLYVFSIVRPRGGYLPGLERIPTFYMCLTVRVSHYICSKVGCHTLPYASGQPILGCEARYNFTYVIWVNTPLMRVFRGSVTK